ncbi:MAG: outer membrane beta-barrel protein [Prevotella sp.]|nr:outer membrane beta-barrel protein [Prevotella sp.]
MSMKKHLLAAVFAASTLVAYAGGLMTNTNYHIAFDRMMARGATFDIDAAYSNPAGLAWGRDGLQLSLNFQKPWQHRDIELTSPMSQQYEGVASAPIVPALFAAYKKDRWALSAMIGIVGSGGFVKYDAGVPMFNVVLAGMFAQKGITPDQYQLSSQMKGKQYIYGGQLNFTYRITDCLAAAAGVRANYYDGYYRGHVIADSHPLLGDLATLRLDVDQRGWGYTPLVSVDYHSGPLTLAARYEFRTKINVPNTTNKLEAGLGQKVVALLQQTDPASLQTISQALGARTAAYQDGEKTRYDMPALLSVAAGYEFDPKVRATLEYHFFDDKNAKMAGDRQKHLSHGTHEFLAGIEGDLNDRWTLSWGMQRTDYGASDDYQQDTSFACDSWSIGLGCAVNLTEKLRLNAGYFITIYDDYTKQCSTARDGYNGQEVFSRTNNVIGLGIDYRF